MPHTRAVHECLKARGGEAVVFLSFPYPVVQYSHSAGHIRQSGSARKQHYSENWMFLTNQKSKDKLTNRADRNYCIPPSGLKFPTCIVIEGRKKQYAEGDKSYKSYNLNHGFH